MRLDCHIRGRVRHACEAKALVHLVKTPAAQRAVYSPSESPAATLKFSATSGFS